jgi:DNA-binding response OmpR family regulator
VIDQLRAMPGGEAVPVLVLGPSGGFMDKVEAIHGGADGYFEKPVDWKALMRRLQHLLDASQSHAARILSVEDDPQQASYLKSILESGGYEVAVCADPKKFETALGEFRPDLVLMDILLPEISGYDLVRYLRQDERNAALPVLFLTTESQMQSRFRSAQVGRRRPSDQAHRAARAPVRGGLAPGASAVPEEPPQPRRPYPPVHAHRPSSSGPRPCRPRWSAILPGTSPG